jgi:hypothetical protein
MNYALVNSFFPLCIEAVYIHHRAWQAHSLSQRRSLAADSILHAISIIYDPRAPQLPLPATVRSGSCSILDVRLLMKSGNAIVPASSAVIDQPMLQILTSSSHILPTLTAVSLLVREIARHSGGCPANLVCAVPP